MAIQRCGEEPVTLIADSHGGYSFVVRRETREKTATGENIPDFDIISACRYRRGEILELDDIFPGCD